MLQPDYALTGNHRDSCMGVPVRFTCDPMLEMDLSCDLMCFMEPVYRKHLRPPTIIDCRRGEMGHLASVLFIHVACA